MRNGSFLRLFGAGIFLLFPAVLQAQSAKVTEESAFILCTQASNSANEAEACTDWLVESVRVGTYRARLDEVAEKVPDRAFRSWMVEAESRLQPERSEAMTAFELNEDLLKSEMDAKARQARVEKLVQWGNRLAPEQHLKALDVLTGLEDFQAHLGSKRVRAFVELCRDSVSRPELFPLEKSAPLLRTLEMTDATLISPMARLVLLEEALENKSYQTARGHLMAVDWKRNPPSAKVLRQVGVSAKAIFGEPDLSKIGYFCGVAKKAPDSKTIEVFEAFLVHQPNAIVGGHLAAYFLKNCDESRAVDALLAALTDRIHEDYGRKLLGQMIAYRDRTGSDRLMLEMARGFSKLSKGDQAQWMKAHPKWLAQALMSVRRWLEGKAFGSAETVLLALDAAQRTPEILFELGRLRQMQNQGALARQMWSEVIQSGGSLAPDAYEMTRRSFEIEGKKQEAASTQAEFEARYPGFSMDF